MLLGTLGPKGVTMTSTSNGAACASLELHLSEPGANGKEFTTRIDCQCFGKRAEAASAIPPGTAVLFEGKLAKRKGKNDQWEVVVSGFELVPMTSSPTPGDDSQAF